jgi:hypothetical protein
LRRFQSRAVSSAAFRGLTRQPVKMMMNPDIADGASD